MTLPRAHLDEATWERLATGEPMEPQRRQALDHVVECARCTAVYRSLLALEAGAREAGLIARPARPRRWLAGGFAALAACAAVVALWPGPAGRLDQPSAVRGGEAASVALLPPALAPGGRPTFAWTPVAAATRYRIAVFTEDGRPVWTREVDAPPVTWPEDTPRTPGACRWRVEALRGGAVVARSPLTVYQVTP